MSLADSGLSSLRLASLLESGGHTHQLLPMAFADSLPVDLDSLPAGLGSLPVDLDFLLAGLGSLLVDFFAGLDSPLASLGSLRYPVEE